jgi:hypothetical protein
VRGITVVSTQVMEEFLYQGKLNPIINSTQKDFYKLSSAWLIEDDLTFTTGETVAIKRLFKFLDVRFQQLPSDTTVHNTLAALGRTYTLPGSNRPS